MSLELEDMGTRINECAAAQEGHNPDLLDIDDGVDAHATKESDLPAIEISTAAASAKRGGELHLQAQ
jgi:hypothetical protein